MSVWARLNDQKATEIQALLEIRICAWNNRNCAGGRSKTSKQFAGAELAVFRGEKYQASPRTAFIEMPATLHVSHRHECWTENCEAHSRQRWSVNRLCVLWVGCTALMNKAVLSRDTICSSCLHRLSERVIRRQASVAATAEAPQEPQAQYSERSNPPVTASGPRKAIRLLCSPVLSRPPLITRDLTAFEKAYYLYQKRLNERLALPFSRYFYYKKGTPQDIEWKRKAKARRGTASRDVGLYNAYAEDGWNDEELVGSRLGEPEDVVEKLIRDAEGKDIVDAELQGDAEAQGKAVSGDARAGEGVRKPVGEVSVERPLPRTTDADRDGDLQSLSRKLDRSLYLLVRRRDGAWRFPEDRVFGRENLHQVCIFITLVMEASLTRFPGGRAHFAPSWRHQHEHVGRRKPSCRPS